MFFLGTFVEPPKKGKPEAWMVDKFAEEDLLRTVAGMVIDLPQCGCWQVLVYYQNIN
jgi:hypothetical protein